MQIKNLIDEDFVNFKVPSMFIATSRCDFKCDKEAGTQVCQNCALSTSPIFNIDNSKLIKRYLNNDITEAIVLGGLEPFDTFDEIHTFIWQFRQLCFDTIVIYTGYYPHEIQDKLKKLFKFNNIIIKFGRFIPNASPKFNELLGVTLASDNQFVQTIEYIRSLSEE